MAKSKKELGNPALLALMASKQGQSQSTAPKKPWYENRLLQKLLLGTLGLGAGTALYFLGRSIIRNANFKAAVNKTDDVENPENYAQRLINAFANDAPFGWGTDEEAVRNTIQSIPHKRVWEEVKGAYKRLTKGRNLMNDLDAELSRTEKREIDLILSMMPGNAQEAAQYNQGLVTTKRLEAWAERIRQAALYESNYLWPWGTDEAAIYAVLNELPTAAAACQLEMIYRRKYNKSLLQELVDELSGEDLNLAARIIMNKPDANGKSIVQIFSNCR